MSLAFKKLTPIFNKILIQKIQQTTKTTSGILLTSSVQPINAGTVVQVGYGNYNDEGKLIPATVKVGDTVLLPDYEGGQVKLDDKEYYVYRETDLLGILQ